jgi:hypothetical protein
VSKPNRNSIVEGAQIKRAKEGAMADKDEEKVAVEEEEKTAKDKGKKDKGGKKKGKKKDKKKSKKKK